MLNLLARPLPLKTLPAAAFALAAAVALYCVAYNLLAGGSETLVGALSWALVNVVPWFLALEAAKRQETWRGKGAALAGGLFLSLALQLLVFGWPDEAVFQLVRRVPWLLAAAGLLAALSLPARARLRTSTELPLLPRQIDWIAAAGNYVELHTGGRTVVHRSPLAQIEAQLAPAVFVRIHRSILVRRAAIARIRTVDLLLHDGTSLKIGKRYRAALADDPKEIHPLVPAE